MSANNQQQQQDASANQVPYKDTTTAASYAKLLQLQKEYDALFVEYKQAVTDYANAPTSEDALGTIVGAQYIDAMPGVDPSLTTLSDINSAQDCATNCKDRARSICRGATYDSLTKKCYMSGIAFNDVSYNVVTDVSLNFTAILPDKKRLLVEMKRKNLALQAKMSAIIAEQRASDALGVLRGKNDEYDQKYNDQVKAYQSLRDELQEIQRQLDQNDEKEASSDIEIQRSYYTFIVVVVLFLLIVFMLFRFFSGGGGGANAGFQAAVPGAESGSSGGFSWMGIAAIIVGLFFLWNFSKYFISFS